jgi:hypothetical protein
MWQYLNTKLSLLLFFPAFALAGFFVTNTNITPRLGAKFVAVWILLSVFINVSLTSLICLRIILTRRQLVHLDVFEPQHLAKYTGVMAILVESALPLAIAGVFAAPFFMLKTKVVVGSWHAVTSMWYFFSVRLPFLLSSLLIEFLCCR